MSQSGANVMRFSGVELDLAARELRRDGEAIALEPRVFKLLEYLVTHRERAVDKDDIQDAVWKGVIVSETALTRAIMKARRAVGDTATKQSVIRTVHGHGYQFVAPIDPEPVEPAPVERAPAQTAERSEVPEGRSRLRWLTAAVVALAIAMLVVLRPVDMESSAVRVAVMPVHDATDDNELAWVRLGLMGLANDLLQRSARMKIAGASDVMRYTERNDWVDDVAPATATEHSRRLSQQLGVSHMLVSRLDRNAGGLRLTYSVYAQGDRVDNGTMVGTDATRLMEGLVQTVVRELGPRASHPPVIAVVSDDPFVNEAHSRGLSFALEGRCADAQPMFRIVTAAVTDVTSAHLEAARCARILGQPQEAEDAFKAVLAGSSAPDAHAARARALNGLGTVYVRTGRPDEAADAYRQALDEAVAADDAFIQGKVMNSLAILAKDRRDFAAARDYLARSALAYSDAGLEVLPGHLPAALANVHMSEGKFEQAAEQLELALERFRAVGDRRTEAMMLNNFGYLRRQQARFDEAENYHRESLAIRRDIDDRVGQGRTLGMLSTLYERDGRYDQARIAASEAVDIARAANDALFIGTGLAQLAQVEHSAGNVAKAVELYRESKSTFERIDDHSRRAQVGLRLANLALEAGDYAHSRTQAQAILSTSRERQLDEPVIEALILLGDLARAESDLDAAKTAYQDALSHMAQSGFESKKVAVSVRLANVNLDLGELDSTAPLLGFLIEQDDTSDGLRVQARYAFARGDGPRAVRLLEKARDLAGERWSSADEAALARYRLATTDSEPDRAPGS